VPLVSLRHPLANRTRGCARNPLRRRIDDVESRLITVIVVLFLIAAPLLGIITGRMADAAGLREQRAEQSWHPAQAVLLQSASAGLNGQDGGWDAAWVNARWGIPGGGSRTGVIAVELNAKAGQRVSIWVTGSGQITHPPLSHDDVLDGIGNAVLGSVAGLALLLVLAAATAKAAVNRRRMAAWGRAWAVFGPRWTSLR
jgi:hypothetical protein